MSKKPAMSPKPCKIGPRLQWRTNRKLHTHFRLVPKSMTLDDLERPKPTLAQNVVLRSPPEKFERRQTQTVSGKMWDDSSFQSYGVYADIRCVYSESGRQTTVGLSKCTIFIVCYWLYVRKHLDRICRLYMYRIYRPSRLFSGPQLKLAHDRLNLSFLIIIIIIIIIIANSR